ncbi:MAG: SpoIIE family protein phosphatase [Bacteroidetes bacterium]|nr:SpoIIE family protein phosphatase [Bacteroidota bacterium]
MQTIRDLITKYRKQLLTPALIFLFSLVMVQLYFTFEITRQPNDECIWSPKLSDDEELGFFFEDVKFEGVTWNAGIRDGDQLIEINGKKIENLQIASLTLYSLDTGDSATYRVSRDGRTFDAKVEVKKLTQIGGLAYILIGAIWLLVGAIVINAKPDGFTQVLFFRIGATLVLFSTFTLLVTQNIYNPLYSYKAILIFLDNLQSFGGVFLPFLIIHFFWVFPRKFSIIDKKYTTKTLYLIPFIIFVSVLIFKFGYIYDSTVALNLFLAYYNFFVSGLLLISAIIGLVSLFINYLRLQTKNERNAIFIILVAYTIGVCATIYTVILGRSVPPSTLYNSPLLYSPIVLIALIPIAFGFSIFKYSLMDVTDVLKNTLLYGVATVSIAAIYFLIIYILGQSLSSVIGTEYQGIIAAIIFIVFAIIFQSTKERFQELITRRFYPEQFAYQKVILKFSGDVVTIFGLENILRSTSSTFVEALRVNRFGIMLKDKSRSNVYNLAESIGFRQNELAVEVNIGNLAQLILSKKDSNLLLVIEDNEFPMIFPEDHTKLNDEEIFTILPLKIQSRIIGFLLFGLKHSGSKFAGKDLELLLAAANQTAVAIENARLYESESEKLKLDRDLENARLIQDSLLPTKFPSIEGLDICGKMIPAMHVGGDYFDLIPISDKKLFAVIGDVSGKGLAASFYMSKLQTMMQLYCNGLLSPKEVLMEINQRIYNSIEKNWFITVSIALIDSDKKTITFARAGHTPLLITTSDGAKEYTPRGIGIGLEKGEIFNTVLEEIIIPLEDNSLITLYSDGITELMDHQNNFFGTEKLNVILGRNLNKNCSEIMGCVLDDLIKHRNGSPQNDDITLVLLKSVY